MARSILVAYATRFGSTQGIAEAVAAALGEDGAAVDAMRVEDVRDVGRYDGVVIGSAVHRGHLLPRAIEFVHSHQQDLSRVPVALFCVYISNPPQPTREAYLGDIRGLLRPASEAFFAGRFDRRGAALLVPKVVSWFVPPIDRRNWSAVHSWARSVAPLLTEARTL